MCLNLNIRGVLEYTVDLSILLIALTGDDKIREGPPCGRNTAF